MDSSNVWLCSHAKYSKALEEAAQQICPNVDVRILDGHNIKLVELARAASDIALSLVDCLQETFGPTLVVAWQPDYL